MQANQKKSKITLFFGPTLIIIRTTNEAGPEEEDGEEEWFKWIARASFGTFTRSDRRTKDEARNVLNCLCICLFLCFCRARARREEPPLPVRLMHVALPNERPNQPCPSHLDLCSHQTRNLCKFSQLPRNEARRQTTLNRHFCPEDTFDVARIVTPRKCRNLDVSANQIEVEFERHETGSQSDKLNQPR
jgi:hypothetical protein